ncbi:hypothetical protein BD311DRAFT_763831 [Dichomitus squalens]|uniref:Uncharacterized protein n=1 Tax=Dichomitus squalens TaxID=114155 RepID=A0A4V2JZS3_9APHY|nr:hypothetical protein BD311DRAFT_763831 [Dichomitus squalens]
MPYVRPGNVPEARAKGADWHACTPLSLRPGAHGPGHSGASRSEHVQVYRHMSVNVPVMGRIGGLMTGARARSVGLGWVRDRCCVQSLRPLDAERIMRSKASRWASLRSTWGMSPRLHLGECAMLGALEGSSRPSVHISRPSMHPASRRSAFGREHDRQGCAAESKPLARQARSPHLPTRAIQILIFARRLARPAAASARAWRAPGNHKCGKRGDRWGFLCPSEGICMGHLGE